MNNSIIVNISELKKSLPEGVKVRDIKDDLESVGAEVLGTTDENGNMIMVINGDVDFTAIEAAFDEAGVTLEDFIIEDDDFIPDYDNVDDDVFENLIPDYDKVNDKSKTRKTVVNEKKEDCCPKKKAPVAAPVRKKNNTVNLHEALNGTKKVDKKRTLDEVINSIVGKDINESVAKKAMDKARRESENKDKFQFLREKLGVKKFNVLVESLESGKKSMGNFNINGKNVADYTTEELGTLLEKVNAQIAELESKVGVEGLNETESAKLQKTLELRRKLAEMLNDEIDFRNALTEADEEKSDVKDPFGGVDAVPTGEEKSDDEKSDEEKTDDADDDKNPDEDETVELSQIVITLASKDAAEDMKKDLLDAGVPEDAIEIEKAEDDEEDENKSDSEEEKSEEEEKPAEENGEEKQEESVKAKGQKLNEDDENADAEKSDEEKPAEDAEKTDDAEKDNADEEPYKLTLTDTEYANQLADVLQNIWGMSNDEFNELIGGELVTDEDPADDSEKEDGDDEAKDADDSGDADTDADEEDFNPEDIFKGL